MKKRDLLAGLFLLVLMAGITLLWLAPGGGRAMPAVTLPTLEGDPLDLGGLRGRPLLITFWASDCSSCLEEIPHLNALHRDYGQRGVEVIGIAMHYDPAKEVARTAERRGIAYTVALDRKGDAAEAFGNVQLTPTTFLISPKGRIVYQKMGPPDWERVEGTLEDWLAGRA
ncbi:Peroxiredoxin [Ectothiorhodospira mobilis]|uniref:Peroxiredoxin n=1 Tax=Ectothiorhodospira mobilis TaxID=195064 RepID=A0A1I4P5N2_ECTMO|nr:TlpA disulfide reductase family protein [Ectothiorhodospira mobilis]SFM23088.1 Peroxiredoxin [Ectothiorhodospira mobilis]